MVVLLGLNTFWHSPCSRSPLPSSFPIEISPLPIACESHIGGVAKAQDKAENTSQKRGSSRKKEIKELWKNVAGVTRDGKGRAEGKSSRGFSMGGPTNREKEGDWHGDRQYFHHGIAGRWRIHRSRFGLPRKWRGKRSNPASRNCLSLYCPYCCYYLYSRFLLLSISYVYCFYCILHTGKEPG